MVVQIGYVNQILKMNQKTITGLHTLELTFKMNEWVQFNPQIKLKGAIFNTENTEVVVFFEEKA